MIYKLIDEIQNLSETRHDYVHGAAMEYDVEQFTLSVKMGRLLQPLKKPRRKLIKVTASQIRQISDRLHEIGGELLDLAAVIDRIDRK